MLYPTELRGQVWFGAAADCLANPSRLLGTAIKRPFPDEDHRKPQKQVSPRNLNAVQYLP